MELREVIRWRSSLFAFIFSVGVAAASWVTRTPALRDAVGASIAQVGVLLFGVAVGSLIGVLSSAPMIRRTGTRTVIITGGVSVILGLVALGLAASAGSAPGVFVGFALFGLGGGLGEVALNVDGADIEQRLDRSVLPALHGFYSLGAVTGAVAGIGLTAAGVPVLWHMLGGAAALTALAVWAARSLPAGLGRASSVPALDPDAALSPRPQRVLIWRNPALLLLGAVLLALALAEGSAGDWLPLIIVDGLSLSQTLGSVAFAVFAAVMTIGRFSGHILIGWLGKQGVLQASVVTLIVGVGLVALSEHPALIVVGVVLWGLGSSLGFPVALSIAGDNTDRPAETVGAVATVGYLAFLVGPPALGFLGEHLGLRTAILTVVGLLVIALAVTVVLRRISPPAQAADYVETSG